MSLLYSTCVVLLSCLVFLCIEICFLVVGLFSKEVKEKVTIISNGVAESPGSLCTGSAFPQQLCNGRDARKGLRNPVREPCGRPKHSLTVTHDKEFVVLLVNSSIEKHLSG